MADNALRNFITKKWTIHGRKIGTLDIMLLIGMTWAGIMLRYCLRDVETQDYTVCLGPWIEGFRAGGMAAFKGDSFNYTMPYMFFLYLISKVNYNSLYLIKLFSSAFDLILAILCGLIVYEYTKSDMRSYLAYGIVFNLPTIAVNSGLWGQCDVIYVTFIVASFYMLLKDKSRASMILYGLAFAIKLQTLFVFPFYVFMWVKKKIPILRFLYIPAMYIVCALPGLFTGRSFSKLMLTYVEQGNTEPWMLSWHWPNIWLMFGPMAFWEYYSRVGLIATVAVIMLLLYFLVSKDISLDKDMMIKIMLMFAWVVPFFLPYMHERYGYLADIFALILFFKEPKKFLLPMLGVLISFVAYTGYLNGETAIPEYLFCFVMAGLVSYSVLQVFRSKTR